MAISTRLTRDNRFETFCGDWEPLGATSYAPLAFPTLPPPHSYRSTRLTYGPCLPSDCPAPYQYGESKANGTVSRVSRAPGDASTLWAATSVGRVFITKNADADPASAVVFERLDEAVTGVSVNSAAPLPNRFVSGIAVDPANANRAWVTYSGYNAATPTAPGHVFEVVYDPGGSTVTWTRIDWDLDDLPLNDVALDSVTGDVYVSNDFGVLRLAGGGRSWVMAGTGMPLVEVASLTIVPGGSIGNYKFTCLPSQLDATSKDLMSRISVKYTNSLVAPIREGDILGNLSLTTSDGETLTGTVIASRDVAEIKPVSTLGKIVPWVDTMDMSLLWFLLGLFGLMMLLIFILRIQHAIRRRRRYKELRRRQQMAYNRYRDMR